MTIVWEQRKFVEFVKNVAKKNKDNIDLEPYAVTNDRGFIAQKDAHDDFGYMSNVDRTAYNIVPPNSFAYNPARINVGSLGYYEGTENVIVSSLYEVFQTEEYIDDKFLLHWFKSDSFPRWIEKLQEGSVRLYFYFDKLVQCQMMVPSLEEQKRISAYLDDIDHLITLHQCKYNVFKKNKVNAWEQRKLEDWGTFYYGHSCPKWSVTADATTPCIRYGELYTKFGTKIDRIFSYTNMPTEKLRFSKGKEVLIPRVGEDPMDYNHCTWLSMPDVAIGEMISVFNTEQDPLFTATMFNATLQKEFAMRVEGGSVTNLYFEKLKNIEVSFPKKEEQKKIARFFEEIDNLITLHQCKQIVRIKNVNNDEKQRKPIKKFVIYESSLFLVNDILLLYRMILCVTMNYILLRLNVVKYQIIIIIIENIVYYMVGLLIVVCYLIIVNNPLITIIYVEINVVIIKGDDEYARIRS